MRLLMFWQRSLEKCPIKRVETCSWGEQGPIQVCSLMSSIALRMMDTNLSLEEIRPTGVPARSVERCRLKQKKRCCRDGRQQPIRLAGFPPFKDRRAGVADGPAVQARCPRPPRRWGLQPREKIFCLQTVFPVAPWSSMSWH